MEAAFWERMRAAGRVVGVERRYLGVEEYDPVLRSHCRLGVGEGQDLWTQMETDSHG